MMSPGHLAMLFVVATTSGKVDISPFPHSPGIYYEEIGKLHLTKDKWSLTMKMDLQVYLEHEQQLNHSINRIIEGCNAAKLLPGLCTAFQKTSQDILHTIERKMAGMRDLTGIPNREKRGIINGIGSVAKTLFGTMDYDDARQIDQRLDELESDAHETKRVLLKQTRIAIANLRNFNETAARIQENEGKMLRSLYDLKSEVNTDFQSITLTEELNTQFTITISLLKELLDQVNDLIDYFVDLRVGIINPNILPMSIIIQHLKEAMPYLPPGTNFPMPLAARDRHTFNQLMDVKAFIKGHVATTIIEIPLVNAKVFTINKVHALPYKINSTIYAYTDVRMLYAIIDPTLQEYVVMTEYEIQNCKNILRNYVCESKHPLLRVTDESPCEITMLKEQTELPRKCRSRLVDVRHTLLIDLVTPNTWLYVAPIVTPVTISCSDNTTEREKITGTGKLRITGKCVVTAKDFKIETVKVHNQSAEFEYLPPINLTLELLESPTHHAVLLNKSIHLKSVIKNPSEMLSASVDLHEMQNELIETTKAKSERATHLVFAYSIQVMFLIIVVIIISVIIGIVLKRRKRNDTAAETANRESSPVPTVAARNTTPSKYPRMLVSFNRNTAATSSA